MNTTPSSPDMLNRIADLVEDHYILPDAAHQIASRLRSASGLPDWRRDPAGFAEESTTLLRAINDDRHLSVRHLPEGVKNEQDEETWKLLYATQAGANAGGVGSVVRNQGAATLLIAPYLSPLEFAKPYLDAAMRLVDGATFLMIDLRDCRGGSPDTVAHLCSYFLGEQPVHLQDVVSRDGSVERFVTDPAGLSSPLQTALPLAVLTSAMTFSGGEDLAYTLQACERAVIVGEKTGGGAHPRQAFELAETLEVHIPIARSVNAVTGSNWEGLGVVPDLPCPATEAPERALASEFRGEDVRVL